MIGCIVLSQKDGGVILGFRKYTSKHIVDMSVYCIMCALLKYMLDVLVYGKYWY